MSIIKVQNPFSGQVISELPFTTDAQLNQIIEASSKAFKKWRNSTAWERSELLLHAAEGLVKAKEEFATLICQEAGKPIQLARGEVERGISVLRWAAGEAQRFSGELIRLDAGATGRAGFGIHTRFPRGIVLGITPYNFPLNLVLHKVAPAIACGCSILIKPSLFTPLTALRMAQLFETSSAASGLVQIALTSDEATAQLTRHPEIAKISFTGSAPVGWMIRRQAPEKPTTLELGGNAWVIVNEDTPTELFPAIAQRITGAAYGYAGQSCISVQNAAVASSVWNELESYIKAATLTTVFGDPKLTSVVAGPLIHAKAADKVRAILDKLPDGALAFSSEQRLDAGSAEVTALVAPTLVVLEDQKSQQTPPAITQEEIFGPVMTVQKFTDLSQIIEKINSSRYGLQTGIYTQHWPTIEKLYRELNVGGLVVNDVPTTRYDHQPYGGMKDSGQGREGVAYAMEEMTESKFLSLSSKIVP